MIFSVQVEGTFRVDRVRKFRETGDSFSPAYATRFQEGEFRKRIQFMFGGTLQKIKFVYSGPSVEAVLDRLPTAEILDERDGRYTMFLASLKDKQKSAFMDLAYGLISADGPFKDDGERLLPALLICTP